MRTSFALILVLLPNGISLAQPAEVNRILRNIDFEERRLGNVEDLPMHWSKVEGPGLMHYVNGALTTDRARDGKYSFHFELNGGGLVYRYDPNAIRVQPGAHYRVEVYAQTTVLPNARARLTAYFADIDGRLIQGSIRHSELYAAESENEPWKKLAIELSAKGDRNIGGGIESSTGDATNMSDSTAAPLDHSTTSPTPAYLVLELALLQPMHYAAASLGQRTLFTQDIRGSAWFDSLSVSQVPKVLLSTDKPGNIFHRGEPARLEVDVNDRFTDDLAAQLVVRDARGAVAFQRSGAMEMPAAQALGPGRKRLYLELPELPPGWYSASLVMSSQGKFVGEQTIDIVLLADARGANVMPDPRFGVIATDLPFDGWSELPDILPILAAGRVKLAVWSEAGDVQQVDSAAFDRLLERLQQLGITPTACLAAIPPDVKARLLATRAKTSSALGVSEEQKDLSGDDAWVELLQADTQTWQPQLAFLIARHANHLDRWQLGADNSDAFVTRPAMRAVYDRVYREFAALVQAPDLAMPWPAWYELDGRLPATVALSLPPSVLPEQIPLYIQDLQMPQRSGLTIENEKTGPGAVFSSASPSAEHRMAKTPRLSISLRQLEPEYGREVVIRDMAERITQALAAGAERIDVPLPFTVKRLAGDALVKQPQEMLIIQRTLLKTLGGSTFRGKVPIAEDVEAFLFDKGGVGVLVLWSRGGISPDGSRRSDVRELPLSVGPRPVRVDLWGNVSPVRKVGSNISVDIGEMPILLVGIDGAAAQLRASIALDRPLLESSFKPHTRKLSFTNPYRTAIAGTLRLKPPAGWTLSPPTFNFTLNPGETFQRELTIEFPYNSFAGPKIITAEVSVQAETNTTFSLPIALSLGLSDVGMQTLALRDGKDVIVQQMITNYGEKPIDYTAFAIFPGQARQERLVTNLGAGRTTVKKYRFGNVGNAPGGLVRSGVKEQVGMRILNEEVPIQ
ncbi:MAG TPA: NEW3 domain-containing protein [Tepidisphaeraceae bacterium]|nr:NEW3 domain-containing protein [Tepidisphaeraceae bacterium]